MGNFTGFVAALTYGIFRLRFSFSVLAREICDGSKNEKWGKGGKGNGGHLVTRRVVTCWLLPEDPRYLWACFALVNSLMFSRHASCCFRVSSRVLLVFVS